MGTKANPGQYDVWETLLADEPYFILRARDPHAAGLVRRWAQMRTEAINAGTKPPEDRPMIEEALTCADHMDAYYYLNVRRKQQEDGVQWPDREEP